MFSLNNTNVLPPPKKNYKCVSMITYAHKDFNFQVVHQSSIDRTEQQKYNPSWKNEMATYCTCIQIIWFKEHTIYKSNNEE